MNDMELFVTCSISGCDGFKPVSSRAEQKRWWVCETCFAQGKRSNIPARANRLGGLRSSEVRRERAKVRLTERFDSMTPQEIFNAGYRAGYQRAKTAREQAQTLETA